MGVQRRQLGSNFQLFLLIMLIGFVPINETDAQNGKEGIGVLPFTSSVKSKHPGAAEVLTQKVTDAIVTVNRFIVVERSIMDALAKEKDYQMGYDFANSQDMIQQGHAIGAKYLLMGHLGSMEVVKNKHEIDNQTSYTYSYQLSLSVKIVNVETGQVISTENLTPSKGSLLNYIMASKTEEAAWDKACEGIYKSAIKYIRDAFPLELQIIQIEKIKKDKASMVLISGGKDLGLYKNAKLIVYELTELSVNGVVVERQKEIGKLTVKELEGDNLSICKVSKGGEVLKQKIESGAKLICKTN